MNKSSRDRLVGGFGAAGWGWVVIAILMYFIAYSTQPMMLQSVYIIGAMGVIFLSVAIVIGLKYRQISE